MLFCKQHILAMEKITHTAGYGSEFESNDAATSDAARKEDASLTKKRTLDVGNEQERPTKQSFPSYREREDVKGAMLEFLSMDIYSRHKKLVNDYILYYGGSMKNLTRSNVNDKTDIDVIHQQHRFIWHDGDEPEEKDWQSHFAKRYYDKLFKEYCLADLSRYKDNKIALRWRTEAEVVNGKGQFECGSKKCQEDTDLTSWEVNFGYHEHGEKRNALVKLRLCVDCSGKLNYHRRRKVAKSNSKGGRRNAISKNVVAQDAEGPLKTSAEDKDSSTNVLNSKEPEESSTVAGESSSKSVWSQPIDDSAIEKTRTDEMEDYLVDLFM